MSTTTNSEDMTIYRASKLFTHLCVRDDTLYGFKLLKGELVMLTTKGYYSVKLLQAASNYDSCLYVKFKGCIYKYDPDDKELPWSSVCYA